MSSEAGGPGDLGPRGLDAVGTRAAEGLWGPWGWPGAASSASPGREQAESGWGPGADQWPGRPHTKRLSSPPTDILQISTSRPPRSPHGGDGLAPGDAEARKRVRLFRGLFAQISFQRRKMCCPRSNPSPLDLTSDPSPRPGWALRGFSMRRGSTMRVPGGDPRAVFRCPIRHPPWEAQGRRPSASEQRPGGGLRGQRAEAAAQALPSGCQ